MNKASDPVLEFLDGHDIAVPVSVLDIELDPSRATIARALSELESHGLIETHDDYTTHYQITDLGRDYLDGKVDADNLPANNDTDADGDADNDENDFDASELEDDGDEE
ncbi:ArsR family transcriptional regulator [Natrinema saccharevitans]|nr:ArsR family transcriptional regulator [Natrinema saccharevitans]